MHFGLTIMFQDHCVINLVSLEKQSRPNHVRGYVRIQRFHQDIALCPVEAANCYSNKVDIFNVYPLLFNYTSGF